MLGDINFGNFPPYRRLAPSVRAKRPGRFRRFTLESLEERALLTTVVPYQGGLYPTHVSIDKPDLYALTGIETDAGDQSEHFNVNLGINSDANIKITIYLSGGTTKYINAGVDVGGGEGVNVPGRTLTRNHGLNNPNANQPIVIEDKPNKRRVTDSFGVGVLFIPPLNLPLHEAGYTVFVNVEKEGPPPPSRAASSVVLTSTPNPSVYGHPVTFKATVTGVGSSIPTGPVTFVDSSKILGTAALASSGIATFTTTDSQFAVGAHAITAIYGGDSHFSGSTSSAITQVVVAAPHVAITSFIKDSASDPLYSNGDYNLTYQVRGANLPQNPKLTIAVYWATGTTASSIITGIPPVATSQLKQAIGTWTFPVNIAQLITPPAKATNLVAVLDNNHVLPASEESNTVVPLSTAGAPTGYYLGDEDPQSIDQMATVRVE